MPGSRSEPLSQLEVLVVDCQATAAAPRGHLLELGWARVRDTGTQPHACLISLPDGEQIPPAVTRITGIVSAGGDRLRATHPELSRNDISEHSKLLRLGTRPGAPVALRPGPGPPLDPSRLASALWWV